MRKNNTDHLIAALATQAKPMVKHPSVTTLWVVGLGGSVTLSFAMVMVMGLRADIHIRLSDPAFLGTLVLLIFSGICWGWAPARLTAPRWPLAWDVVVSLMAGVLAWILMMIPEILESSVPSLLETSHDPVTHMCAMIVTFLTMPSTWLFLYVFRLAMPSSPRLMMAAATATGASFSMLTITLLCASTDDAHIVMGHLVPAILMTAAGAWVGRRYLRW